MPGDLRNGTTFLTITGNTLKIARELLFILLFYVYLFNYFSLHFDLLLLQE